MDIYLGVPPTPGVTNAVVNVMEKVLDALAVVTKEFKQSRISGSIPVNGLTPSRVGLSLLRNFREEAG